MTVSDPTNQNLTRQFWLLSIAVAMIAVGFQGIAQLLKVLYELRLGFDAQFVGTLFAVGAISFALTSVPAGALGGRYGPRRIMALGALITCTATLILASTGLAPSNLRAVGPFVFEILGPMGWSLLVVNQITGISSVTNLGNRKKAFGLKEAIFGAGLLFGALLGGLLPGVLASLMGLTTTDPAPYGLAIAIAAAVSLLGLLPLILLRPIPPAAPPRFAAASLPPMRPLLLIAVCAFLNNAAFASAKAFSAAYMDSVFGLPTSLIGVITSVGTLLAIVAALSSARMARGRGSAFAMLVASLTMSAALLLIALSPHWATVAVGVIGALAVVSLWMPAYQVVQMEMVAVEWRGVVAGAASMAMSLGFGSMSFIGGRIAVAVGYTPLYVLAAVLALASAGLAFMLTVRHNPATRPLVVAEPEEAEPAA